MDGGGAAAARGPSLDEAGFRGWMSARGPALRRKAFLLCGDWHCADDLVQESLISIYSRWSRVAGGSNIDAYANRVLVGKYVDSTRRPWRRERAVDNPPDRADAGAARAFAHAEDTGGPLAAALAALAPAQRVVVVLRFTEDMTVQEIASTLHIPAGTVKSRLSRGIETLRGALAAAAPPQPVATTAVQHVQEM